jgi:prepilin-type N-terminal cleavage/methylation domain-containing protein
MNGSGGFSLLELIIAMVVFAVGVIPIALLFIKMRYGVANREQIVSANLLAQDLMETIASKKWDANSPSSGFTSIYSANLGPDGAETSPSNCSADYDDIDDYNNCTDQPQPGFRRHVSVTMAGADPSSYELTSSNPSDEFKQVTVTVTWTKDGQTKSQTMTRIFGND